MAVLGYAQGAALEPLGSELTADVAAGSLVLPVEWTGQFDDGPGVLSLNGTTYAYSVGGIDEDAAMITLDSVTAAAATTGDAVTSVSGGEIRTELVLHVSCGGGDDVEVVVPFRDRDLWPEGEYDDPVEVLLSDDLETIIDVPGRTPMRDAANIDPDTITDNPGLQAIYDAADAAAAAAAAAALGATTALTAANGKSKVWYSATGPGSTANTAGDIWFQKDVPTQTIIGQWEGMGGTTWESRTLRNEVIANLDAGKLVAGSAFTNALWVKTNFTLGDATTDGVIQSHDFAGSSQGVFLNKYGIVAKGGSIAGATITGGVVKTGDASARVQMLNAANPLESGNVWGLIEFYNNLGWNPGRIWASESGTEGTLRISSPHSGASTDHSRAAAITLISEAGGSRRMNLYAGQMEFTANRYNFTSDNGTAIDFRLFNSGGEFSIMDNNGSGSGVGNIKLGLLGGPNFQHQLSVRTNANARHSLDLKCSAFGVNLRDSGGGIGAWLSVESSGAQAAQVFGGGGQMALSFLGSQLRVTSWNWESFQPIAASAFNVNSDMHVKTSRVRVAGALDALRAMPVYDYDTPHGQPETASEAARLLAQSPAKLAKVRFRQRGILAQDLAKSVRHAVYDDDTSSKSGMQVDLYGLLATTIAAVQELDAKVTEAMSA